MSVVRSTVLIAAILVTFGSTARAEFLTFTDEASFMAAVSGVTSGQPAALASSAEKSASGSLSNSAALSGSETFSGPRLVFQSGISSLIAVGGWFLANSALEITVSVEDSPVHTFWPSIGQFGFFGFLDTDGVDSVIFDSGNQDDWVATDFTLAHATVPEPASGTLLGMGAIGLLGYGARRRRKLRQSAA